VSCRAIPQLPKSAISNKVRLYVAISRKREDLHYPSDESARNKTHEQKRVSRRLPKVLTSKLPLIKKIRKTDYTDKKVRKMYIFDVS
jgi:hypothetical protein